MTVLSGRYRAHSLAVYRCGGSAGFVGHVPDFPFNLPRSQTCRHLTRCIVVAAVSVVKQAKYNGRMTEKHDSDAPQRVAQWQERVAELLGREPRGLRDIAAFDANGEPAVIRVASVVEGKPFPTLFWLVDPAINLAIDRLEAGGLIARLQAQVDASPQLRACMAKDHDRHRALRHSFLTEQEIKGLEANGMMAALDSRGIGGIAEPDRVRCLHTWYAAHWVEPNTIGALVDEALSAEEA